MINFLTKNSGKALAGMMRNDKIFASKNLLEKKLRKLLEGFAIEIAREEGLIQLIWDEYDINTTTDLITEWESAVGIPDDCFDISGTIQERRENVLTKLTSLGVSTKQQFIDLGANLGFVVDVKPGVDSMSFPYIFPVALSSTNPRWTMLVEITVPGGADVFPYAFPFVLSEGERVILLKCVFQKLVPSMVNVVFSII